MRKAVPPPVILLELMEEMEQIQEWREQLGGVASISKAGVVLL